MATGQSLMTERNLTVRFLTPAFLGNAEQDGQWRTPPFKHLLRAWWRVAWAEASGFADDVSGMRSAEGALFGTAAGGTGRRSRVRVRLERWDIGRLACSRWEPLAMVRHPEVNSPVDAGLYLGYGPVTSPRGARQPTLKKNAAIQAGEQSGFRLAFPGQAAALLDRALALMDCFGTVGGRARNGWGSFRLEGAPAIGSLPLRDWRDCLDRDWPHAIGRDERGALIWQTDDCEDWRQLMRRLAEVKIALRTQFPFPGERPPHPKPRDRHWLAYPVTNHRVQAWRSNPRLPNSLRFKAVEGERGRLHGLIFHVPCRPPAQFHPEPHMGRIREVWRQVHRWLDGASGITRAST